MHARAGQLTISNWFLLLLLGQLVLVCVNDFLRLSRQVVPWLDSLVLLTAAATSFVLMLRTLPSQNVVVVALGTCAAGLVTVFARQFDAIVSPATIGKAADWWFVPVIWFVAISNARLLAKRILAPWRENSGYGFFLVSAAAVLACIFQVSFDVFGGAVRHYWEWHLSAAAIRLLLSFLLTLVLLVALTPWFISKKPGLVESSGFDITVWFGLHTGMCLAAFARENWVAGALVTLAGLILPAVMMGWPRKRTPAPRTNV